MNERETDQRRQERIRQRRRRRRRKRIIKKCRRLLLIILLFVLAMGIGKKLLKGSAQEKSFLPETIPVFERVRPIDIALDAGHGGMDQGADNSNVLEKTINLEIAQKVKEILEKSDYRIGMVREDDSFIELKERAEYANVREASVFVSIHCNSSESGKGSGIETYYSEQKTEADRALAEALQEAVISKTNARDRETRSADYVVLTETKMPSAFVERR